MYNVLLVEDEKIIRKGIKHSVPWEKYGCHVIAEASNGEEGIQQIIEYSPDIVITDINMPIMDGLEMITKTKLNHQYVAVILTGYSEFEYAREAIKNGVSAYVLKPLNMEEMCETLQRAVLEVDNVRFLHSRNQAEQELKNLSLLGEAKEVEDLVARQILEYLYENYQNKITLSDLEEKLHYSERYLNQKFQKTMGTTVIEYLNRYRVQKALEMIRNKQIPIVEIGWECGIGDYKYFNHVFKKYIGCSVKEYRARVN